MTHSPNHDLIPGGPHEPAPTGWTIPKIEIFDYQEPADTDPDPDVTEQPAETWRRTTVDGLKQKLAHARALNAVKRRDKQLRHVQTVTHRAVMANATEWSTTIERNRRERTRDAAESSELAQLHRQAARSGERARIRADIQRSAEMRALRVDKVRRYTMAVGFPVMVGFAAISTPSVQKGMVQLLDLERHSVGWWTAWFVEPLLIAVATAIIVVKSVLKMSGGWTDWRADTAKWGALLFSVLLNMLGGWTGTGGPVTAAGEALGHSVGAIGAAVTAWLIGVIVDYTSKARPWDGAKRLADLGLLPTVTRDAVTGELVTLPGDAPAVGDADTRQAVTATVTETHTVTTDTDTDTADGDGDAPAVTRRPSPSPLPADTVTPAKRHTVTATVTRPAVTYKRVTVTPAPADTVTDGVTTDGTDTDAPNVTADADTAAAPSPARPATDATGKVRPLSRDLIDERFRDWTTEQIEEYAAERARAVAAETGNKTAGMREYFLVCLALGVDPKGSLMARVVGIKGEGLGRAKAKQWHGELAVADAEQILRDAVARATAEVTAGGRRP